MEKIVDIHIEKLPEQMQVRVQLRKNNQNYGQPLDIVYVTVNP